MYIQSNISALNALNRIHKNNKRLSKASTRLPSGLRINKSSDDVAGLSISEKMRAQIRGLNQAQRNAQDAISLIQTAEGALGEIVESSLQRIRELAVQAGNDTLVMEDRQAIQKEIEQIKEMIDNIAINTQFNTKKLLEGSYSGIKEITDSIITGTKVIEEGTHTSILGSIDLTHGLMVTEGVNDTLRFTVKGINKEVKLESGNYTLDNLLIELNTKLVDSGLSASHSNNKLVLTLDTTGAYEINGLSGNAVTSLLLDEAHSNIQPIQLFGWTDVAYSVTIVAGVNDTLSFEVDGKEYTITIVAGTYNTNTTGDATQSPLAAALDDAMQAVGAPITTKIWGISGHSGDPRRVIEFTKEATFGEQSLGRFSGTAKETLFSKTNNNRNYGVSGEDSYNLVTLQGQDDLTIITGKNSVTENIYATTIKKIEDPKNKIMFQIGANSGQTLELTLANVQTNNLGIDDIMVLSAEEAQLAIKKVDDAIKMVSTERSRLGAFQNRLEHTISSLANSSENLQASESRIRDIDMANEIMEFTKSNILNQVAQAMLAQANQGSQAVLELLR